MILAWVGGLQRAYMWDIATRSREFVFLIFPYSVSTSKSALIPRPLAYEKFIDSFVIYTADFLGVVLGGSGEFLYVNCKFIISRSSMY